jgi:protocatechuate 3,4-dioxygenase beta subunit
VYPGYAGGLPRHIHFVVSHPRHRELVTRLFFKSDPAAADESIEAVTVVLDEVRADKVSGWVGGYEFVLAPK